MGEIHQFTISVYQHEDTNESNATDRIRSASRRFVGSRDPSYVRWSAKMIEL
jgi:hypothetical protein